MLVNVALPLPIDKTFIYRVPSDIEHDIQWGIRVIVPFGAKKLYAGVVIDILSDEQLQYIDVFTNNIDEIKYILEVLDDKPIINNEQWELYKWVADYYLANIGDVLNNALPSGLKIQSETKYQLHPDIDLSSIKTEEENLIYEILLEREFITNEDIQKLLGIKNIQRFIKSCIDKNIIYPTEECEEKYIPKNVKFINLSEEFLDSKDFNDKINKLERRAPKQIDVILYLLQKRSQGQTKIPKAELTNKFSISAIQSLIKKGYIIETSETISRIENKFATTNEIEEIILSDIQKSAYQEIKNYINKNKHVLLYGVPGSGKTEIYSSLIQEYLDAGKQVLYLLPEISLTTYLVNRLQKYFGDKILVYHSKFNLHERVEIWNKLLDLWEKDDPSCIVVGPRSALFLPFYNLGLVVVDEEHDPSYKQQDLNPRYHARDMSYILANNHHANLIMGSATPSLESWYNAKIKKIGFVEIKERYSGIIPPLIEIVDMKSMMQQGKVRGHFSHPLLKAIDDEVKAGRQVLLFQNRRGYSSWMECKNCGYIFPCPHCDVNLTYHKSENVLKCHYCGYTIDIPTFCPKCKSNKLIFKGFGTERVETELQKYFPDYRIDRLDLDTTRRKHAFKEIIQRFERRETQILVGTQMISKGLDFSNIQLVGVLNADNLLAYPNFRVYEHALQLLMQVAGRAGRREVQGRVYIQTYALNNPILPYLVNNNYEDFAENELKDRWQFKYPPYYRLIQIQLRHKKEDILKIAADALTEKIRNIIDAEYVKGPVEPVISKIRDYYYRQILIKIPRDNLLKDKKQKINEVVFYTLKRNKAWRGVLVDIDVDPV
ncbi:MAG: primosomal protein N' [Bacteroidales bacterium]|jgi:primosomal protein N' (replication factor Y)|nr:primosomal protein N' [Bacteroidales bacterium]MDI9575138.1 primosomal protein N' [Bacteroidota bacterium]MDY0400348.1 primosomal protein N' [Bacteroidales bacterium]HHW58667.1 primosomal protein N' [Bacteroidales bacterium]HOB77231.1 primosomal protein N' [Bacteroidales bacterium]